MKKLIDFLKKFPLITAVIAVVLGYSSTQILSFSDGSTLKPAVVRILLSLSACAFLYLISGEKTFNCCTKTTGYIFKYLWPLFIIPALIAIMSVINGFATGQQLKDNWPIELILTAILYLFVGIFEETTFRAIINDALMAKFKDKKGIFVIIAVVSSFVFGGAHVIGADFSDPAVILPAVMKTLSAGLMGLTLLFLYWKTRNLWGIALIHGLYDFIPSLSNAFFVTNQKVVTGGARYASAANSGAMTIGYGVQIAVGIAIAVIVWFKIVRKIDFEELRKTW